MVKKTSKATIIKLLILLFFVMWLELIMVVKFFTEEYLVKGTMEKSASSARLEYTKNTEEGDKVERRISNIRAYENSNYDNVLNNQNSDIESNDLYVEDFISNVDINENERETYQEKNINEQDNVIKEEIQSETIEENISSRAGNPERVKTQFENEKSVELSSIYQGYPTVGKIEIPKTGVDMYILSNQTVGGMEIAACQLYSTGELNKSGKTLILGHNYRNGKLFSNNNKLNNGDTIKITTLDGTVRTYTIYNKIITTPEDVSYLLEDSDSPEIILSSCSDDNQSRIVIMAR